MTTRRFEFVSLALAFCAACGGSTPASAPPEAAKQSLAPPPRASTAETTSIPYFVIVSTDWVGHYVRASDHDVEAWAHDPANASAIKPSLRHILIRLDSDAKPKDVAVATRRANAAFARIEHGEDFGKVAQDVSEDPGTAAAGGELPGDDLSIYVVPFRDAAEALAPGQVTKRLVRTTFACTSSRRKSSTQRPDGLHFAMRTRRKSRISSRRKSVPACRYPTFRRVP